MEDRENGRVSIYHYNEINQLIREEIQPLSGGGRRPEPQLAAGGVAIYKHIKEKDDVDEVVGVITLEEVDDEDDTIIYRKGSSTMQNLTPREKDINGLSYVLVEPIGQSYTKTAIEQVNATGVLVAEIDGPNHVSVYPVNPSELDIWISTRPTANQNPYYLTVILRSISINHKGEACNVD